MKTYRIEITETLQKTIEIEASSDDEAINIVKSLYNKEEIAEFLILSLFGLPMDLVGYQQKIILKKHLIC